MADSRQMREAERQTREFKVSVDGVQRGAYTMQIRRWSDGTISMHGENELRINLLIYKYHYTSAGTEVWKNGRLISLDNTADYNGKQYVLKAAATRRGLQLNADGAVSLVDPYVWVSSYWQIPERLTHVEQPRDVDVLDSDQGHTLQVKLQRMGDETVMVAGARINATHYRMTGDAQVDLWYDLSGRLVWQESTERGHKVTFECVRIANE